MLFCRDALLMEVGLAAVEEGQWIRFTIELGKIELLEMGRAITMLVVVTRSPGTREEGRCWALLLESDNLPLQVTDGC